MFFDAASRLFLMCTEEAPVAFNWSDSPETPPVIWDVPVPIRDGSNLRTFHRMYAGASETLYRKAFPRPENPALDEILAEY